MARKTTPNRQHRGAKKPKVGSDPQAVDKVGGAGDFGIPVSRATVDPGGRAKGPEQGTGPTRSDSAGTRTNGVGAPTGPDGAGSGGDIDPDIIGLDGRGGVAANPAEYRTLGPDITESGRMPGIVHHAGKAASNQSPRAKPGTLDTVDHSGGDVTTSGDESSESTNPEIEEIAQESELG